MVAKQIRTELAGPYLVTWGPVPHRLPLEIVGVAGHLDASFLGYIQVVLAVPPLHEPRHDYLGFRVACHLVACGEDHRTCSSPRIAVYY